MAKKNDREEIVRILMKRDGMSRKDALGLIEECRKAMLEEQSDEPIEDILGLEPDYIFGIL